MTDLISVDEFRATASAGFCPAAGVWRLAIVEPDFALLDNGRRVPFCLSDGSVDRMGDTIAADGWQLANYQRNNVVLWAHDALSPPIGRGVGIAVRGGRLVGDVEFPDADLYPFADLVFRLLKAGFLHAGSVGFDPLEWSFVHDDQRPFGIDFKRQELLEFSICPVPANANALVQARAAGLDTRPLADWAERVLDGEGRSVVDRGELERLRKMAGEIPSGHRAGAEWKCGAARDLPLDDSDAWDGGAAAASIFEHAGGGPDGDRDFDPAKARRGFLLYDGAAPKLRGSYKDPFAHVAGGELKAVKGGIRAAASRLPQSDASAEAKAEAEAVIKHYEEKFGMAEGKRRAAGGMNEGDPSAGGYIANCGRGMDAECGLKNPAECMVHGPSMEDKALARLVARQVGDAVRQELGPLVARAGGDDAADHMVKAMHHARLVHDRMKDLADGDFDGDGDRQDCVRAMQAHANTCAVHCDRHLSMCADVDLPAGQEDRAAVLARLAAE